MSKARLLFEDGWSLLAKRYWFEACPRGSSELLQGGPEQDAATLAQSTKNVYVEQWITVFKTSLELFRAKIKHRFHRLLWSSLCCFLHQAVVGTCSWAIWNLPWRASCLVMRLTLSKCALQGCVCRGFAAESLRSPHSEQSAEAHWEDDCVPSLWWGSGMSKHWDLGLVTNKRKWSAVLLPEGVCNTHTHTHP